MTADELLNDIPIDLARAAHQWTSHVPETRAEQERRSYAATLAADYENLARDLNDARLAVLAEEFKRYRERYRRHFLAHLIARSRCASTMITGGSGFNVTRNRKANETSDRRRNDLLAYRERALTAIRKVLHPELAPIMTGDADAGARIDDKLTKLRARQELMKAANLAIRRNAGNSDAQVAALAALGLPETAARKLLVPDFVGRIGFADYEIKNNGANIRRLEGRAVVVERTQATPAETIEGTAARLEDVPAENRVRLFFPGKPSLAMRDFLKSRGFRWAPSIGCWQAYRNHGAIEAAKKAAGVETTEAA